jgi:hypothetical protein
MRLALIRTSDGVVENVILADETYTAPAGYELVETSAAGPGWSYDGQFSPPVTDPPAPVRQFSVLDFMDRFTEAEQVAIVQASMVDAPLKLWYDRMLAAEFINLDDPRTIEGVEALYPGLLTQARVNTVLGR